MAAQPQGGNMTSRRRHRDGGETLVRGALYILAAFCTVLRFPSCPAAPRAYLGLGQAQSTGQLLPLRSNHVVILFKGSFQTEQLRGRERRPDAFGFPGERAVQEKVLRAVVLPWKHHRKTPAVIPRGSVPFPATRCLTSRQLASVLIKASRASVYAVTPSTPFDLRTNVPQSYVPRATI